MSEADEGLKEGASSRDSLQTQWIFSSGLQFLADHFPGKPLVPAFHQVRQMREAVAAFLGYAPQRVRVKSMKFLQPIAPEMKVDVSVERKAAGNGVSVRLSANDMVLSQGEMELL